MVQELALMDGEAKTHDGLSASWRTAKASDVIEPKTEGLRIEGLAM